MPARYGIRFQELLTASSSIYLSTVTFWRYGVPAHLEGRFRSVGPSTLFMLYRLIPVGKETDDKAMYLLNMGKVTYKVTFPWTWQELVTNNFLPLKSQTCFDWHAS